MAQLFHNNLIISFSFLLWTEVFIRLMPGREIAVSLLIFLKKWMKCTNTWSSGGCSVNHKTVQENLPLLFHAFSVLQGLHHSSSLLLTYWPICRSQWFPLPPSGLPLLLALLADGKPEDATGIILWTASCWSDYPRLWCTACHRQFQYPVYSLRERL